jgi:chlorobactene glucosyltransferase
MIAGMLIGWSSLLLPAAAILAVIQEPQPVPLAGLVLATLTSLAVYATQIALVRNFRIPFWYGLLFPLACTVGVLIAINAAIWRGRGRVAWKGRFYPAPESATRRD